MNGMTALVPPAMALLVALPLAGALAALAAPRRPEVLALGTAVGAALVAFFLLGQVLAAGPVSLALGGWAPPLGIVWRVDGLSAPFLAVTATLALGVAAFAGRYLALDAGTRARRFWAPFLFLWAALDALFLSRDVFNLYVTLELVSLAAVALVTLEGRAEALSAGLRYLFMALAGSAAYLLGVALLYARFGALDLPLLAARNDHGPEALLALALMSVGLMAKSAFFPLHAWLPPAHSAAPAPASALLSGLVVKGGFYILLRLWFELWGSPPPAAAQLLGACGAGAVLWGSLLALREPRLKLLVAWSTVAQIGYLLLAFPLAQGAFRPAAYAGAVLLALAHALAKGALFLSAGVVLHALGHDRIAAIAGAARHLPLTLFAMALAGVTLMGLPPSGGFTAKWLLLGAALGSGQWWWAAVLVGGGLLAAGYVFRVLGRAFENPREPLVFRRVPLPLQVLALTLAAASLGVGFAGAPLVPLVAGALP
jgi:formate hydrogenlyase subunit 3/multisubunit Na+/H+ antiporter MnhD subunit